MSFYFVKMNLESDCYTEEYKEQFFKNVYFIGYYISGNIALYNYNSELNGLQINAGSEGSGVYKSQKKVIIGIPFNQEEYERAVVNRNFGYYCNLYRKGILAAKGYNVPVIELLEILDKFEQANYRCEWQYKGNRLFKEYNLKVTFMCELTTDAFTFNGIFYNSKTKQELCRGVIFRTIPSAFLFHKLLRKIAEKNCKIVFIEWLYEYELGYIDINKVLNGVYNFEFSDGSQFPYYMADHLDRTIKRLTYKGMAKV